MVREKLDGPIVWIGHSFAGNLISPLINRFERTVAVALLDCSCAIDEQLRKGRAATAQELRQSPDHQIALFEFYDTLISPECDPETRARIKSSLSQCDPEFLIEFYEKFDEVPERPKKEIPALILEAENFFAKNPDRSFIQYYPKADREIIPGSYHFFFFENPEYSNQRIRGFLEKL